ncbi:MAG: nitrile hydratase accessory protein [Acidimicrobiales bacterium]|nr:nitrile hydratase accessory protein [Acidimicrobiales bacterium]
MSAPLLPERAGGPVFDEVWQAEVFATAQVLADSGLFTWAEWTQALTDAIAAAQAAGDPDLGDTYYDHWLAALEGLCRAKGAVSPSELDARAEDWRRAYEHTPHGQPVELAAAYRTP